jgi:probable blue pigment (indigoidine) exporter
LLIAPVVTIVCRASLRWMLVTAVAPIAWGSNYYITRQFLPPDQPLYGAIFRALPAGLLLLALRPLRPRGSWWWRTAVLGTLNVGAFFVLIYVTAQLLPTNVASTIMAMSPMAMMLFAWLILSERARVRSLAGAALGIAGVLVMLATGAGDVDPLGVVASAGAMVMASVGYVLAKKWSAGIDVLALTAWQMIAGALVLLPAATLAEGAPPSLDGAEVLGFAYVSIVATALAFAAWFAGLRHLDAGTVGLLGLLNPVTGVLLGTAIAAEPFGSQQLLGLMLVFGGILLGQPARVPRGRAARARLWCCGAGHGGFQAPNEGLSRRGAKHNTPTRCRDQATRRLPQCAGGRLPVDSRRAAGAGDGGALALERRHRRARPRGTAAALPGRVQHRSDRAQPAHRARPADARPRRPRLRLQAEGERGRVPVGQHPAHAGRRVQRRAPGRAGQHHRRSASRGAVRARGPGP